MNVNTAFLNSKNNFSTSYLYYSVIVDFLNIVKSLEVVTQSNWMQVFQLSFRSLPQYLVQGEEGLFLSFL